MIRCWQGYGNTQAMTSSIPCRPGAIVRIPFEYTSGPGIKRRPVVIVSAAAFHRSRADAVVVALSTNPAPYFGDCEILEWKKAGLPASCKAKGVIRTVEVSGFDHHYGDLTRDDFERVQASLKAVLGL